MRKVPAIAAVPGADEAGVRGSRVPLWLKLIYSLFVAVLVPIYWYHHGPANFLWGSDIALFMILLSMWSEKPLANSMMAIGVLPFEIAWIIDFAAGSQLLGMTAYMFDQERPLFLRALSLFHVLLPVMIVFLLRRLGYDRRALPAQTLLTWLVLPATWLLTDPADNINRVFGLINTPQTLVHPLVYLVAEMIALPLVVYWPCDRLMRWLVRKGPKRGRDPFTPA